MATRPPKKLDAPLDAQIQSPCDEDWEAMGVDRGGRRRYCESCSEHVHDLSEMTRAEAELFLDALGNAPACIAFAVDDEGQITHREPAGRKPAPPPALVPVSRLRRSAAQHSRRIAPAVLASALAACAPHGDNERMPEVDSAESIRVVQPVVPIAVPSADPPPHEVVDDLLGDPQPETEPVVDEPCETIETPKVVKKGKRKIKGKKRPPRTKTKGMRVVDDDPLAGL